MKRTIIAVISIVLIAFAFTACRQSVVIPFDPMPSNPNTPSGPSVPDGKVIVGDVTYDSLEEAIEKAPEGSVLEVGAGTSRLFSPLAVSKGISINGSGIDKTIIEVNGSVALSINGTSSTISNLTISDTGTTFTSSRRLVDVSSSKVVIDSVKLKGEYSAASENPSYAGVVTDGNTTDVTITNSVFSGIRLPIEIDYSDNDATGLTAVVKGNYFDIFEKLTIDYSENVTVEDNTFGTDTNDSFQISLDCAITPAQAEAIAAANECKVQTLDTNFVYDAEGFLIDSLEALKSFASGSAGSAAKLVAPVTVTEAVTFSNDANNLTLNGNGNEIIVDIAGSTSSLPAVAFHVYGSSVIFNDVDISVDTGCINVIVPYSTGFTYDGGTIAGVVDGSSNWTVNMGVAPGAASSGTVIKNATFIKNSSPVYAESADFTLNNVGFENGIEIANYSSGITKITDCYEIDGTEYPAALNLHGDLAAEKAMEISRLNNNCLVSTNAWNEKAITYNKDGIVVDSVEDLEKAFEVSTTTDEPLAAVITESFTVDSAISVGGSGLTITTEDGIEPITLKAVITIDNASDITFSGVDFNVEGIETAAIHVNNTNTSDITFYDCVFERSAKGAGALSIGHVAKNITIEKCTFDNFITAIYMNGTSGRIVDNTISTYGGIYLAGVTEPYEYADLDVSGNKANYGEDYEYDSKATDGSAWDNTLRIAVTDLSDEAIGYANTLYRDNEDMNVAVITETGPVVLWANGEEITQ